MRAFGTVALALALSCGGRPPPDPASPAASDPPVGKLEAPVARFPPTPAGKTMGAWWDAFNSGDEARIREFAATYKYPSPDELVTLRKQSGGFQLTLLEMEYELALRFVVKEKNSPTTVAGWLRVKDGDPAVIETFELEAIPPGMSPEQMMQAHDIYDRAKHKTTE